MVQTKYTDKNGKSIKVGQCLRDEEGFTWVVKEKDSELYMECDELLAKETIYPRAKYCVLI